MPPGSPVPGWVDIGSDDVQLLLFLREVRRVMERTLRVTRSARAAALQSMGDELPDDEWKEVFARNVELQKCRKEAMDIDRRFSDGVNDKAAALMNGSLQCTEQSLCDELEQLHNLQTELEIQPSESENNDCSWTQPEAESGLASSLIGLASSSHSSIDNRLEDSSVDATDESPQASNEVEVVDKQVEISNAEKAEKLKMLFHLLDLNKDMQVDRLEFSKVGIALATLRQSSQGLDFNDPTQGLDNALFASMDVQGNGYIREADWVRYFSEAYHNRADFDELVDVMQKAILSKPVIKNVWYIHLFHRAKEWVQHAKDMLALRPFTLGLALLVAVAGTSTLYRWLRIQRLKDC